MKPNQTFLRVLVVAISYLTAERAALGQSVAFSEKAAVRPTSVDILWQGGSIEGADRQGCENLGSFLTIGSPPWNHGIFTGHRCLYGDRTPDTPGTPLRWQLHVRTQGAKTLLSLDLLIAQTRSTQVAFSLSGPPSSLSNPALAQLAALKILDELPMARPALSSPLRNTPSDPNAPREYVVFTLRYSALSGWIPRIVGTATRPDDSSELRLNLEATGDLQTADDHPFLWAQVKNGPGAMADVIDEGFEELQHDSLMQSFAKGYVGARYGKSLTKGDLLLQRSALVSIFTEVRGGPARGLRWYWDFAPESKTEVNGKKVSFTWSRASLGWSFGMQKNKWLGFIDQLDVVPKLGLTDLDARVPLSGVVQGTTVTTTFRAKNVLNVGIESGIETHLSYFLARLWAASDLSGLEKMNHGSTSVRSLRAGLDLYRDLMTFAGFRISVLGFAAAERLSLLRKEDDVVEGTYQILQGLNYRLLYAGAGMTLTW